MPPQIEVDATNASIVRALQRDARTNFAEVARDCNVSIDTVTKRLDKMRRAGIVKGMTLLLNPRSFGFNCVASLEIDVDYPHVNEVVDWIEKRQDVVFCTQSMGRSNIFAIALLKDVEQLNQLRESMKGHPMIRSVAASIWVDEFLLCPENFEFKALEEE